MSCQIYGMTTIECTLCEHSIVMNKKSFWFSIVFGMMDIQCRRHKNHQSYTQGGNEREHEKKKQKNGKNSGCSSGGSAWNMRAGDDAAGGRDTDIRADSDAGLCGGAVQRAEIDECDKECRCPDAAGQ